MTKIFQTLFLGTGLVSIALAMRDGGRATTVLVYVASQAVGAVAGVWLAHAMFALPILQSSAHDRATTGELIGESTATFGLLGLILTCSRHEPRAIPGAVAAYITAAYWFTSSTSFANPAVTFARSLTDSFAGIQAGSVVGFVVAQVAGAVLAYALFRWLQR